MRNVEKKCIPSILQDIGHMLLQNADAVWGQFVLLSHVVQLGGEHEGCKGVEKQTGAGPVHSTRGGALENNCSYKQP